MGEDIDPETETSNNNPLGNRADRTLTAKDAWVLTEEKGHKGKDVADAYDVTESWVSQRKTEHKESYESGRESVSPGDFEAEELKDALGDEVPDSNPYDTSCPLCDNLIDKPSTPGIHPCPHCGNDLEWDESEL